MLFLLHSLCHNITSIHQAACHNTCNPENDLLVMKACFWIVIAFWRSYIFPKSRHITLTGWCGKPHYCLKAGDHIIACVQIITLLSKCMLFFCQNSRWPHFWLWEDNHTFVCDQITLFMLIRIPHFLCVQMTTLCWVKLQCCFLVNKSIRKLSEVPIDWKKKFQWQRRLEIAI